MRLKYTLYEQKSNWFMSILIFFQTIIVLVVLVGIISAITSRYEKYKPLKSFFQGNGLNMHMDLMLGRNGDRYLPFTESVDLEKYLKKAHVISSYKVQMTFDIDFDIGEYGAWTPTIGYDDEILTAYTPELEAGRWLKPEDADTDIIEIVLAQKGDNYHVGDVITLTYSDVIKEESGGELSVPVQAIVVGILADGASPIMRSIEYGEYLDFRDYYYPYYRDEEQRSVVFVSKRDIQHNNELNTRREEKNIIEDCEEIWPYCIEGPCFIQYEDGITEEEMIYNSQYLLVNGRYFFRYTSEEMRENSKKYIMDQMDMLIPILIGMIALTLMSMISNTVIMVQSNMRNFSIYYMLGLTWRKCISIHIGNILLTEISAFLITMFGIAICEKTGLLDEMVLSLGGWQLFGCFTVILLFVLFSVILSYILIGRKSAKVILGEADK